MEEKIPESRIIRAESDDNNIQNNHLQNQIKSNNTIINNDENKANKSNNKNKLNLTGIPRKKERFLTIATSQINSRRETYRLKNTTINENEQIEKILNSEINSNQNIRDNSNINNIDNTNYINNRKNSDNNMLYPRKKSAIKTKSLNPNRNSKLPSKYSSSILLRHVESLTIKQYSEIVREKSMKNNLKISTFENRLNKIEAKFVSDIRLRKVERPSHFNEQKQKELEYSIGWLFYSDQLKKKKREAIQQSMKNNDKLAIILALLGIILNITASTEYISFSNSWNAEGTRVSINIIPNNSNLVVFLRTLTSLSTLALFIFLYRHYAIRLEFDKFKQKQPLGASLYSAGLLWMLIFELVLCSVHSPPFLNNIRVNITQISGAPNLVDLDIFLSSLIPIRVYLLFRYYSFYSSWADDRAEKICNECNTVGGISFAIKAELKERPYTVVGVLMILSILIFGYALRNLELSFMQNKDPAHFQDWTYVYNGFWCIMVTILTVGYGDFYPQTSVGRAIAVIACLWGTFLISLMVVSLTISVEFTPQEQKAYEELKKGEVYRSLKTKALNLIRFSMKLRNFPEKREEIKDPDVQLKYIKTFDQLKHSLNEFSISRKFVLSREHESGAENILYKLNENVGNEMENIIIISNREVTTLLDYLKLSQTIQSEIENYMEKLDKMTEGLEICLDAEGNENDGNKEINKNKNLKEENPNKDIVEFTVEDGKEDLKGNGDGQDFVGNEALDIKTPKKEGKVNKDKNMENDISCKNNESQDLDADSDFDLEKYSNSEIDQMHQELIYRNMLKRIKDKKQAVDDPDGKIGKDSDRPENNQEIDHSLEPSKSEVLDFIPLEGEVESSNSDKSNIYKDISEQENPKSSSIFSHQTPSSKSNSISEQKSFEPDSERS